MLFRSTPRKQLKKAKEEEVEKETEQDEEAEEATSKRDQRTPNGGKRPSTPMKAGSKNTTTSPYFPSAGGAKTDASPVSFLAGLKMRKRVSAEQLLNDSAEREEIMLDDEQDKGKEKQKDEESKQGRSLGTIDHFTIS